jgi:hypothetical protein
MVPPLVTASAVPSLKPKQLTGNALQLVDKAAGDVIIDSHVTVQPFTSDTVTVYVPALNPLIEDVVNELLHK